MRQLRASGRVARPLARLLAGAAQRACTAHAVSVHAPAVLARWAVIELGTQREDGAVWGARPLGRWRRLLLYLVRARVGGDGESEGWSEHGGEGEGEGGSEGGGEGERGGEGEGGGGGGGGGEGGGEGEGEGEGERAAPPPRAVSSFRACGAACPRTARSLPSGWARAGASRGASAACAAPARSKCARRRRTPRSARGTRRREVPQVTWLTMAMPRTPCADDR